MDSVEYALLIGLAVLIAIVLAIYFRKDDFDLRSIKDLQVEIKEKLVERDALDFQSLEKAKKSSEEKTKIMREELKTLKKLVEEEKEQRGKAYTSITENIKQLHEEYKGLQASSTSLVAALKDSTMRGNWGEVQLQRVLELSNMVKHVDFERRFPAGEGAPFGLRPRAHRLCLQRTSRCRARAGRGATAAGRAVPVSGPRAGLRRAPRWIGGAAGTH